jgi:fructose-1,6-bisphosphatase/inositol monophosphatase family enzyme
MMIGHFGSLRDPFEGQGARRTQRRLRIEGLIALTLAIVACGLTAALWLLTLSPLAKSLGLV